MYCTECEYHHEVWEHELSGLLWKPYIQQRHTNRHQGTLSLSEVRTLTSALMMTMNILYKKAALPILCTYVYKYGCTYPHSHFPHPLLSRIYTPWYTWPAGQQPKRPEETRRSLLDWNSPLTERIYHPNYHESSFPKPFLSLKKRQGTIRRIIKTFSIGELAHKHLRNGNASAVHVVEVNETLSFCLWCTADERMRNQTQCAI